MSSSDRRRWNGGFAGDGRREARSYTPQDHVARPPDRRRHRGAEKGSSRNQRDLARDMLIADLRLAIPKLLLFVLPIIVGSSLASTWVALPISASCSLCFRSACSSSPL